MDDQQTIRLECLRAVLKGRVGASGMPTLGTPEAAETVLAQAEELAAWVIGDPGIRAVRKPPRDTTADAEVSITVQKPDGYLINKDFGGWYFTAPGGYGAPSTHWATEAEAIVHAQTHKAMASAWEPEDPQMGELAHPIAATDTDFDMKVAASIRRLNRMGVTL